jgi:hypothetical protein
MKSKRLTVGTESQIATFSLPHFCFVLLREKAFRVDVNDQFGRGIDDSTANRQPKSGDSRRWYCGGVVYLSSERRTYHRMAILIALSILDGCTSESRTRISSRVPDFRAILSIWRKSMGDGRKPLSCLIWEGRATSGWCR